jgi:hypothetical protein
LITAFEEHPNLREVPVDRELAGLAAVKVRKFANSAEGFRQQYAMKKRESSADSTRVR